MIVVGLGPGDWSRIPAVNLDLLVDPSATVVVRTLHHPAARRLTELRPVIDCDDLYRESATCDEVYRAIADRVWAMEGKVVYAVPGSPLVGEFAVGYLRERAATENRPFQVLLAESFLDVIWPRIGVDPFRDGFQLLNGHEMPSPLVFDKPTVIGHLDTPLVFAEVADRLGRVLGEHSEVTVLVDVGGPEELAVVTVPSRLDPALASYRTSMYVPAHPGGLVGAVHAMRRLREECPWDREQTHQSLLRYLVEESNELIEAVVALGEEPDGGADADVEEELGDVLLQVLFHAAIAAQDHRFDIDDVGEQLRLKLIRRHPHVFGEVEAEDAETVRHNWERIKAAEKRGETPSILDGVSSGLPGPARAEAIQRKAAGIGFDWSDVSGVIAKVEEEMGELAAVLDDRAAVTAELGDVLFSVVNLARHLEIDPDLALRAATARFERRFRAMEATGPLEGLSPEELEARWEEAKARLGRQ